MRALRTRTRTLLAALLAAGAFLASAVSALPTAPAAAATDAPRPYVDGNRIRDARTGEVWVPHGANKPALEYACVQNWVPAFTPDEAAAMASWGMDVVRIPLN
ncbi:MAG: hypothetical protein J7480_10180, partial [Microbacteriaceae bacterium]|nr:hypothetical protein [Microbacteriaceae bacterium]